MDMETIETILHTAVHTAQIILESMGIIILLSGGVGCFIEYFATRKNVRLILAKRISLALEFLMAGEILHTIVAQDMQDLLVIGAIIIFRFILTWENSHEIKELEEEELSIEKKE